MRVLRVFLTFILASGTVLLATALPAHAAPDTCVYDGTSDVVTVTFPDGNGVFRELSREAGGTRILYSGSSCGNARVTNTKRIDVTSGDGAQTFEIDVTEGPFAPGVGSDPGTSEIEFVVDLGAGTDVIQVDGGGAVEHVAFVGSAAMKLNGDADTDVSLTGVDRRYAYLGGGDDVASATGSAPRVVLYGEGGNDRLSGGGAGDYLDGAAGSDTLAGGAGEDSMYGGAGADTLRGGDDDDYGSLGGGNDAFDGGAGDDYVYDDATDSDGADQIVGGPGWGDEMSYSARTSKVVVDLDGQADDGAPGEHDDVGADVEQLSGGSGNDVLTGNAVPNLIQGGGGGDVIAGGGEDDDLYGDLGTDTLNGGAGDDTLVGGQGDDLVRGDGGGDTMWAESTADGADEFRGGTGIDSLGYSSRTVSLTLHIAFAGQGEAGEGDLIGNDIENLYGGSGNDDLAGNGQDNYLSGGGGADTIDGGPGSDSVVGGSGDDPSLTGGDGYDFLYGYDGNDTFHTLDGGSDYVYCGIGADVATDRDAYDPVSDCEVS
jgi:Ca2+-binding RTX toxin-like protein